MATTLKRFELIQCQLNNVIIAQVTPYAFEAIGWKYFIVYVCTNMSNAVICYFLFPETKNKTLEEIGRLFGDENVRTPPTLTERFDEKKEVEQRNVEYA
jgi:hypothetical protein